MYSQPTDVFPELSDRFLQRRDDAIIGEAKMTMWRPQASIRVIVIGLVWNDGRLLAAEVTDDAGVVKGVRPLGGGVEFGETREEALRREFLEELGVAIDITPPWHALENIFEHAGHVGHEIVFAANVTLVDRSLHAQQRISFRESDLSACHAGWYDPADTAIVLYPTGLAALLAG
jgi:8-oxo-dGTP pyrophosphatase MutT (NUDIX family)